MRTIKIRDWVLGRKFDEQLFDLLYRNGVGRGRMNPLPVELCERGTNMTDDCNGR